MSLISLQEQWAVAFTVGLLYVNQANVRREKKMPLCAFLLDVKYHRKMPDC